MSDALPDAWCRVYENPRFTYVETLSGYRTGLFDPDGRQFYLQPGSSAEQLGSAVAAALEKSRVLHPGVAPPDFFDMRGRVGRAYEAWVKATMLRYQYRTRRTMFREMKSCYIVRQSGVLTMHPSHHEHSEAWSGEGLGPESYVLVPVDADAASIGDGLRLALQRCT